MPITLLPSWHSHEKTGLHTPLAFVNREIPETWRPQIGGGVEPRPESFPTPFGLAESVRIVLEREAWNSIYAERFRILVESLVLGYFSCQTFDLLADANNLGRTLCAIHSEDEGFRFLSLLIDKSSNKVFGGTAPHCFLWPHARRTNDEWSILKDRIARDPNRRQALNLLAEFKASFKDIWNPTKVAWMKGIDWIVRDIKGDEYLPNLKMNSRSVVAVPLWIDEKRSSLVYVPCLAPGFSRLLHGWFRGRFERVQSHVEIRDGRGTIVCKILMPREREGINTLFLGAGLVDPTDMYGEFGDKVKARLSDDDKGQGIISILRPIFGALEAMGKVNRETVEAEPWRFPDVVRIILSVYGDVHVTGGALASYSKRIEQKILESNFPGYPDEKILLEDEKSSGLVVKVSDRNLFYVERYLGNDVGDLRALGYALFMYFVGDGEYMNGRLYDGGGTILVELSLERLFEPTEQSYKFVQDDALQKEMGNRLASIQRFYRSYRDNKQEGPIGEVILEAVKAFSKWVCGEEPLAIGTPAKKWENIDFDGIKVSLARDAYL